MKRIYLFLTFLFILCLSATAQQVRFGIEGGVNINRPKLDRSQEGVQPGVRVGVLGQMRLLSSVPNLYVNGGLLLSTKGYRTSGIYNTDNLYIHSVYNLNYLELPIRVGYDFINGKSYKLFLEGGPYMGYALWGKEKIYSFSRKVYTDTNIFGDEAFKRFDFGVGFAFGVEVAKHYQLKAGYELGLVNIVGTPKEYIDLYGKDIHKNRNFTISLAYMF